MNIVTRLAAFNIVGAGGIAVQLGAIALLVRVFHWHYLPATALAVEAAVLHNFVWHQRWTWKDRPPASWRATAARLARFQLMNGAISLGGNLAAMALLIGLLRVDPVAANLVAIVACALLNFAASELVVFRSAVPAAALLILAGMPVAARADQRSPMLDAWQRYEAALDARYAAAAAGGTFFVQDLTGSAKGWRDAAMRGGVSMVKIEPPSIPDGKIHHWAGAVFVPGAALDTVLERLKQYAGRESEFYDDVTASRLLKKDGDRLSVFMRLRRTTLVTVTYNTEHAVEYRRLPPQRASARSVATRIVELADAGTPKEREKPAGGDRGFLWRLNAYWRYEAVAGGVLVECESVSLSRAVPYVIRPIANPIVDRIASDSLERTLRSLREVLIRPPGIQTR
jgi:putative flippase GtrA